MFDESFVRAARIQEFSARERLSGTARAVRTRPPWSRAAGNPQAFALLLLMVLAFGTAVYLGLRHPYRGTAAPDVDPARITLVRLAPQGVVAAAPGASARYPVGADAVTLPDPRATAHFSSTQVFQALVLAKEYVVASSVRPDALTGGDVRQVRALLDPGQLDQFDRSLARPADDGQHAATGWLVRFDPTRVALADPAVRVRGTVTVHERGDQGLEVVTDHTLEYTVRAADARSAPASLFTVRRQLRLYFDEEDLRERRLQLQQAAVEAGPLACGVDAAGYFRPLLAGQSAPSGPGIDPQDHAVPIASGCGLLRAAPTPHPSASHPRPPARR
ncbi:hypothetical protein SCATT_16320 [Streptantibioticus cattleyicolor NRRL 8057 = DSM 46488]|uniref:Uncharacterized protein n=1 Tax=Streptantibioticus cattleyicolor (strain ATCC 35852 / DSM 46488 / JCM 4925 / NBRC 14057 / NRRL 8057) TaxID=1003195 RepID=F8JPU5_STREN|nr:hypothetical protein [Streptantibioticus cattleyicolor]AEW94003.1 hypothetical protein SCATT_16320 [Streptantibioticus cattleyicolor NRRL 8057 = DSM 46488]MYS58675.1 hypothetical protein [Streptomyces sp. SID5468]CCB74347.1 Membrane protein [Streptantibioticus cattleyicolor NRRL 8057 = DSM 46488]